MNGELQAARRKLTEQVMGRPGVVGTAVGERGGERCLVVYLQGEGGRERLPRSVDGFRVVVEVSGSFEPL